MPTGKPDCNLNSYGVKYLSKEEVQEFLQKKYKFIKKNYTGVVQCDGCGIFNTNNDFSVVTHHRSAFVGAFYHPCYTHYVCPICLRDRRLNNC